MNRAALLLLIGIAWPLRAEPLDRVEAMDFLVQSACFDEADRPLRGRLPFELGCDQRRPMRQGEVLAWRKTDWPGTAHAAAQPEGYMASDAVLGRFAGQEAAIQTFDVGGGSLAFGRLDPMDGGQVAVLGPLGADFVVTQDGGKPSRLQWFLSPDCRPGAAPAAGWLIFGPDVPRGLWAQRVARLRIADAPDACPTAFDSALTRWRRETMRLPVRFHDDARPREVKMDVIVSEHYGGATIADAWHLERFWHARGLGMVRWERWDQAAHVPRTPERAAWFAETGRCGSVPFSTAPGPGWAMVDCRSWTNFRRPRPNENLRPIPWPP
ncbi:hypothetical protein SAMN02745194_03838 [Roseomonas rosea]|uniref:Uncharacterized protein n=1 Tax=Muricoccus roseus TaxID=198092 RepID=A0A1M6NLE0_9PROT|nr:hypothetical protein [Roseomonas rosea]SHJ96404.1 hypothetical protein SAMN02745194_03838 [Roseomonas rosea]